MESFRIIERSGHNISRKSFSRAALKVLYRLRSSGFDAYLVGGALRDLLRGQEPRDFDLVTNAQIADIRKLFRNSKTIGKRFTIVHTYFGDEVIEISPFKATEQLSKNELVLEDAKRRDFTVNALYYDIENFKIVDPLNILEDIRQGRVVVIGDPHERFEEDPIRMLRALKLQARHNMTLDEATLSGIAACRSFAQNLGAGRKYEELTRVFLDDHVETLLKCMQEQGLLRYLWPVGALLAGEKGAAYFGAIQKTFTIHASRGSFSKESHTTLWLRLFFESGVFDPAKASASEAKAQFHRFIEPLGMPFKEPVLSALEHLTQIAKPGHPPKKPVSTEVFKLLNYYIDHCGPELRGSCRKYMALSEAKGPGPKRRGKRGRGKKVPQHQGGKGSKKKHRRHPQAS